MSLILLIDTIVLSSVIAVNEKRMLTNTLLNKGQSLTSFIAQISKDAVVMRDVMQLDALVNDANKEDIVYTVISDENGKLLTSQYASINYRSPRFAAILSGLPRDSELHDIIDSIKTQEPVVEFSVPITVYIKTIGRVTLGISEYRIRQEIMKTVIIVIALNIIAAVVLGFVLFVASKRIILDPVAKLSRATSKLADGDLSARVTVETTGEVESLVDSFNHMLENLEKVTVSKNYVDNIIKSMTDTLIVVSSDNKIMLANAAVLSLLGYEEQELIGGPVEVIFDRQAADCSRIIDEIRAKGFISDIETVYRTKNGGAIPMLFSGKTLSSKKDIYGMLFVAKDVAELRQAEQALRESDERLRQAVRVSHIGIFDHDHVSDTIYWSPQQREIYGWGPDETVTLPAFLDCVYAEDRERIAADVRRAHDPAGSGLFDVEHRIIRRDGALRWLSTRSQTFFAVKDGVRHPVRTVGAVRDITESKRAEEERGKLQAQLTQAQKMESVGRLAGGVAHDFNNMLSVILGHAGLALRRLERDSPLHAHLQQIQAAAQRSANLTRQLLAFARKQTIAPKVLDLNDTMEGMLNMLRRLIGEDIDVAWIPGSGLWPVKIDPAQLDQILANLLVNARDAIVDKGKVTIETENVVLDEAYCAGHPGFTPGRFVMLVVSDDGCGMDREILAHLFEPFFTTKGVGQGTGLGLATVYGIVKQNEGYINVYSEPGKGTTFKIYLPCYAAETIPATAEGLAQAVTGGTETILLVEDEPIVLGLSKSLLEELGYTVLTAGTPSEAIRLADEHAGEIHLLITDVVMPEMNGRDLAKQLLSLRPNIKVLFMSGYTANVIAHRGVLEQGVHFIQKPFSIEELSVKVREVLKKNRPEENA
jgi:PAS domain S-box-containing protein